MRLLSDAIFFAAVWTLVSATPSISVAQQPTGSPYDDYLSHCHSVHVCNGTYIVARRGTVVFSGAYGELGDDAHSPLTLQSGFDIGSIAKQFTAMAVLRLVESRALKLDDKVVSHLPEFPYADVTVRHLLTHTSGIPDALPYYSNLIRRRKEGGAITGVDVVAVLASSNLPVTSTPGSAYTYSNTGYMVLAVLVEHLARQTFADFLQHQFFKPLGMGNSLLRTPENEAVISNRARGFRWSPYDKVQAMDQVPGLFLRGAGGIYSTAPDLLKWSNALHSGRIVSRRLLRMATQTGHLRDGTPTSYGFGLSLKPGVTGSRRISHGGHWRGFKSDLAFYPDSRITVIQLTNNGEDDSMDATSAALEMLSLGRTPQRVLGPIGWKLVGKLSEGEIAETRTWFKEEIGADPRRFRILESELNNVGYAYLNQKDIANALVVFELVVAAFPESSNALDSLADAQEAQGNLDAALASVNAALILDPQSANLIKRAASLRATLSERAARQGG